MRFLPKSAPSRADESTALTMSRACRTDPSAPLNQYRSEDSTATSAPPTRSGAKESVATRPQKFTGSPKWSRTASATSLASRARSIRSGSVSSPPSNWRAEADMYSGS